MATLGCSKHPRITAIRALLGYCALAGGAAANELSLNALYTDPVLRWSPPNLVEWSVEMARHDFKRMFEFSERHLK